MLGHDRRDGRIPCGLKIHSQLGRLDGGSSTGIDAAQHFRFGVNHSAIDFDVSPVAFARSRTTRKEHSGRPYGRGAWSLFKRGANAPRQRAKTIEFTFRDRSQQGGTKLLARERSRVLLRDTVVQQRLVARFESSGVSAEFYLYTLYDLGLHAVDTGRENLASDRGLKP